MFSDTSMDVLIRPSTEPVEKRNDTSFWVVCVTNFPSVTFYSLITSNFSNYVKDILSFYKLIIYATKLSSILRTKMLKNIRNRNFSIHKLKHKVAISKSVEQLLVAPTDITKYVSISIYIHKTFVNLLSEIYGFD